MKKVIITAEVEDSVIWVAGLRTHVDFFRSMTISKPIQLGTNENNEIAISVEPDDLDKYLASQ